VPAKVFDRVRTTDANLTSSNVAEDDAPEWDAATTYASGDQVIVIATHTLYTSAQGANTGNDPATDDGTWWVATDATDYWKPFDDYLAAPLVRAAPITYTFTPERRISGIFLAGLDAETVSIGVARGGLSASRSLTLRNLDHLRGPYTWLFGGRPRESEALFADLPWMGAGTNYTVTVSAPAGNVAVSEIIMGEVVEIGTTKWGAQIGIWSASVKQTDAYGRLVNVPRVNAQIARIPFQDLTGVPRRVQRIIQKHEAEPTVWIGDERTRFALILFGTLRDYRQTIQLENYAPGYIEIEGRT
jgi:hypothetical protein